MNLSHRAKDLLAVFEEQLEARLLRYQNGDETLSRAICYALSGQGKRIRPLLAILFNQALGGELNSVLPSALALEMIHTYSLVHDDLPCMDNDSLRRGRPTVHVEFDPAIALLVGDALLTDAFTLISGPDNPVNPPIKAREIHTLATAIGGCGMVRGQALDLYWTRREGASHDDLRIMHSLKTAALLGASCTLGALTASATQASIEQAAEFGRELGMAYQILDDLIDIKGQTGKSAGKDAAAGKLTFAGLMPYHEAQREAQQATTRATNVLGQMQGDTSELMNLATLLLNRNL